MKKNTAKKPISDNSLFNKINWFISEESAYLNNQLSIANVVAEDHADKNQQRWHWLHLQNFITVLKKISKGDQDFNALQILNISFKYLETLFLARPNVPAEFRYNKAKNTASILRHLIINSNVYNAHEHGQSGKNEYLVDTSNGLQLTIGITDFITNQISIGYKPLNFETALVRTSNDVNISLKLVDAYLLNHHQTIAHLIYQVAYFLLVYGLLVGFISFCLLNVAVNPIISLTVIGAFIAIPVLTTLFIVMTPSFLSKKQFIHSEHELKESAKKRAILESERYKELDSLINNIGATIIFYENLILKSLYGLIFSILIAVAIAIPIIFFGIHFLPIVAGIFTTAIICVALVYFIRDIPKNKTSDKIPLSHPKVNVLNVSKTDQENKQHQKDTLTYTTCINLINYYYDTDIETEPFNIDLISNKYIQFIVKQNLPIAGFISEAIFQSIPLWHVLDQNQATTETHQQLAKIAKNLETNLRTYHNKNPLLYNNLSFIVADIIEIHELENPPKNFTNLIRTVIRLSLPYLPKLLCGTDLIASYMTANLCLVYPHEDKHKLQKFAQHIQDFMVEPTNDQTKWLTKFANAIIIFYTQIRNNDLNGNNESDQYTRQWEIAMLQAAERLLNPSLQTSTHQVNSDPILTIIQSILEILQYAYYKKGSLNKLENDIRASLIGYSIMIDDIKFTEDTQYQFVDHYRYCWKNIPKLYFPTIFITSALLIGLTPFAVSLPIVAALMLGGLFLLPYITENSHKLLRVNEENFGNLTAVTEEADKIIEEDAFLASLLSLNFKHVAQIFSTARNSLRQLSTITIVIGIVTISLLGIGLAHISPFILASMLATILLVVIANILFERYYVTSTFKSYNFVQPGVAQPEISEKFFKQEKIVRLNSDNNNINIGTCKIMY